MSTVKSKEKSEKTARTTAQSSLSIREFARQIDKPHSWVQRRIKEGKITPDANGKIPIETAFDEVQALIDAASEEEANEAAKDEPVQLAAPSRVKNVAEAFNKARLAEKTFQAKLKEIEYRMKKGDLLERADVEADAAKTASALRGRLMSVPVRIAGLCEGRTSREIEEILETALNDVLSEFKKSEFS